MLHVVIDTNIWIRILLRGQTTLPILIAWQQRQFQLVTSQALLDEFQMVWQRPRFRGRISSEQAGQLYTQMTIRSKLVELKTVPPRCRDPKDDPVLATAIDGHADAVVTGDDDLRADEELRRLMAEYRVQLWGVQSFLEALSKNP